MQPCDFFKRRGSLDRVGTWIVSFALLCLLVVLLNSAKNRYLESQRRDRFGIYLQNIDALKPNLEKVEFESTKLLDTMDKLGKQISSEFNSKSVTTTHMNRRRRESSEITWAADSTVDRQPSAG